MFVSDSPRPRTKSILSLLRNPYTWVIMFSLSSGSFSLGFLDPTLALHAAKLPEVFFSRNYVVIKNNYLVR